MKERLTQEAIAMRVVKEFKDGDYVNLGTGMPTLCAAYVPADRDIIFHAENGVLGYGRRLSETEEADRVDFDFVDAGVWPIELKPGVCWFDMDLSFAMIRGGHLDATVLGGLEVSEKGDLANWTRGETTTSGIGGAMDLTFGANRVIVLMEHTTRKGDPKIVKRCKFPLTRKVCVDLIITDIAVIERCEQGLLLKEYAPGWTVEEIQSQTEPKLIISEDLCEVTL